MDPQSGTRIDRASPNDVTILATDRGAAPMNIGAVLLLETEPKRSSPDIAWLRGLLSTRIPGVPRFRHRLVPYLHTMNHRAAAGTALVRPVYHRLIRVFRTLNQRRG